MHSLESAPQVTVVIPTYNRSWGLQRALSSVLGQNDVPCRVLVMDDAGRDDAQRVVESFASSRVHYHRHDVNQGVARNWGSGIRRVETEFVCLLMDDDVQESGFLRRRIQSLHLHPDALFAFSGYRRVNEAGRLESTVGPDRPASEVLTGPELLQAALGRRTFIGACMYRTAAVKQVWEAAEKYGIVADYALNLHLATRAHASAVQLPDADFSMSVHDEQLSVVKSIEVSTLAIGLLHDLRAQSLQPWMERLIRDELYGWLVLAGRRASNRRDRVEAVRKLTQAARLRPFRRSAWTQLIQCLVP